MMSDREGQSVFRICFWENCLLLALQPTTTAPSSHIIMQRLEGGGPSGGRRPEPFQHTHSWVPNHRRAPQTDSTKYRRQVTFEMLCQFYLFFFKQLITNLQQSEKNIRQMANSNEMNLSYITSHLPLCWLLSQTVFYYSGFNIWMAFIVKILPISGDKHLLLISCVPSSKCQKRTKLGGHIEMYQKAYTSCNRAS